MQQRRDTGSGLGILDLKGNSSSTPVTPQRTNSRPLGDEPAPSNSTGTRPPSRSENDTANRINQPGGYPISTGPQVQPYGGASGSGQPYYAAIRFVDQSGGPQGAQVRGHFSDRLYFFLKELLIKVTTYDSDIRNDPPRAASPEAYGKNIIKIRE